MCTVSFSPNSDGFHLLMNRDEKRTRPTALSPAIVNLGARRAVFPREPNGGTWIAVNDAGVCLALINWHRIEAEPANKIVSRGYLLPRLARERRQDDIAKCLENVPLREIRPFRLIAISSKEKTVSEWRWNLKRLSECEHPWANRHWFSSGFDESEAERIRTIVVAGGVDAGPPKTDPPHGRPAGVAAPGYSLRQLRELHRSHLPERGPFSICMHRADASTVSYTEVTVEGRKVTMQYRPGAPCETSRMVTRFL